jgi:N-methylhydantoinase B
MGADPVTVEVIRNALIYTAEEMGVALRNSAYSPNIKERMDHSCALFDAAGRLLAQAEHIPTHLGSLAWGIKNLIAHLPGADLQPGDVWVSNDPYLTGTHLNDVTVLEPVFWQGRLLGYSATKAHHVDVGGRVPGSLSMEAADLFEEGVVVPPRLLVRGEQPVEETWRAILSAVRTPEVTAGDLRAQRAACALGRRRMQEVCARHGRLEEVWERMIGQDAALARRRWSVLPPGVFQAEDCLELPEGLVWLRVAVRRTDDGVAVDFAGTDAQVRYPLNAVFGVTVAGAVYALKAALAPDLPMSEGLLQGVRVSAPPGCLLNPRRPAPVGVGNTETSQRVADVVLRALARALPGRIPAAGCGSMNNVAMGGVHPQTGRPWAFYETVGGGMGARPGRDGVDGVHVHMTNTMNTPIEAAERELPVLFRRYEFRPGSGGAGRWRGGCGIVRAWTLRAEQATVSVLTERTVVPPWGLAGGRPGAVGRHLVIRADGTEEVLPGKGTVELRRGDTLVLQTPGGGGYGDPAERSPELVERDRADGLV